KYMPSATLRPQSSEPFQETEEARDKKSEARLKDLINLPLTS
ncbi:unnamed protein product, partial [marine sediment metagenome]